MSKSIENNGEREIFYNAQEAFGSNIRTIRGAQDQSEFAEAIGCSVQILSNLELGKKRHIDISLLCGIANLCRQRNISLEWLILNAGKMNDIAISSASKENLIDALGSLVVRELIDVSVVKSKLFSSGKEGG